MKFFDELKRRNVIKASIAYLVIAWVLLQVFEFLLPMLDAPEWLLPTLTLIIAIGFPIWIIVSWVYDITPQGIEKTTKESGNELVTQATNKRLNAFIIISLSIAVIVMGLKLSNVFSSDSDKQYAIAVLPFKDMSPEDTQWFCDGVMDEILNHFSSIKNLRVISRTSSDTYEGTDKKIPEIAKELDVDYVLEGSVTLHNNKVKIMAQLIAANDEHIWSKDYSDNFDDIFAIQQDVAKEVFKKLKITLSPEEEKQLQQKPTDSIEAYQLYLKGITLSDSRSKEGLLKSIDLYSQAIIIDPNYADAYAEMAHSYYLLYAYGLYGYGYIGLSEAFGKAKIYIEKAIELNPNTTRAYTVMAKINMVQHDMVGANKNFAKAIELNPNDATAHHHYATYYEKIQDNTNFLAQINIAQRLNPLSKRVNRAKIKALIYNNKIEEAQAHLKKYNFLFSENGNLWIEIKLNSLQKKDWTEAIRLLEKELEKDQNNAFIHRLLSHYYLCVLNDRIKSLYHAKRAFELKPIAYYAKNYWHNLLYNKKFKKADEILHGDYLNQIFSDPSSRDLYLFVDHCFKGEFQMALKYIGTPEENPEYYLDKASIYANLGDSKKTYEALEFLDYPTKAWVFAILKERDSMYYYLDKTTAYDQNISLNFEPEFDPYRKEERYKAFLKKNYLPITHWNE